MVKMYDCKTANSCTFVAFKSVVRLSGFVYMVSVVYVSFHGVDVSVDFLTFSRLGFLNGGPSIEPWTYESSEGVI